MIYIIMRKKLDGNESKNKLFLLCYSRSAAALNSRLLLLTGDNKSKSDERDREREGLRLCECISYKAHCGETMVERGEWEREMTSGR
jgi:hypothetical protein